MSKNILCSTCNIIKTDKNHNLYSTNKEDLSDFPGFIPKFGSSDERLCIYQ